MSTVDSWYLAQFLNITNSTENELTPTIRLNGTSQDAEQIDPICDPYILARFLNECQQINCCEAYNQRIILLLMSIIFFLTALIVLAGLIGIGLWHRKIFFHWRGKRAPTSELEVKSAEETLYLRRMSELNPNTRREIVA